MKLHDIHSIKNLKGKRVLLRAPLNVPIRNGEVADDFRLVQVLPTIQFLRENGARTVIIGHIGRDTSDTLEPVCRYFNTKFDITFVHDNIGIKAEEAVALMGDGDVVLLENLRQKDGEYTNDESFSKHLASLADIYVNDAFAASHRSHASIVGIPSFLPSYIGVEFMDELQHLKLALQPKRPSLFILGGAKFETKEPLTRKFLDIYDKVFIGGALANDFFKAKGLPVGRSLTSNVGHDISDLLGHSNLILPSDVVVKNTLGREVKNIEDVEKDDAILDAGPKTIQRLVELAEKSSFVLWNGPLGDYEEGFSEHTEKLARSIVDFGEKCIVGGGDTVASIAKLGLLPKFGFVSTGGGAMLQFLLEGTLPGIEAIKKSKV